jgi:hypothetical protein
VLNLCQDFGSSTFAFAKWMEVKFLIKRRVKHLLLHFGRRKSVFGSA